jgi:hypothetical protein
MAIVRSRAAKNNSRDLFEQLVVNLKRVIDADSDAGGLAFEDFEVLLLRATNEVVRRCLETRLQSLADALGSEIVVGTDTYRRHHSGRVKYFSLSGAMMVNRWTYRRVGERNGKTIAALDRIAGIARGATPALAFAVAQGVAKAPIRSVEQDLLAAFRIPPSRSKMDRIGRSLGEQVHDAVPEIEPSLRQREHLPTGAKAINMGLDRTTIPMEELSEDKKQRRVVRYRMGYVATFCITDENCRSLVTRRYAAPAHEGPAGILARMKADLEHSIEQDPGLTIGVVQDGAPEMWNLMREMLDSIPHLGRPAKMGTPRHWRETIDRYHLMEKLARVLELLLPRHEQRRTEKYAAWNALLDRDDNAIANIERWIDKRRYQASRRAQDEIHRILGGYLICRHHFRYASLAHLGLHEGSGVTEGACKSLITMRAKRSGQRWRPVGITSVLAVRSLLESDRLPSFWKHFSRRFVVTIQNAA